MQQGFFVTNNISVFEIIRDTLQKKPKVKNQPRVIIFVTLFGFETRITPIILNQKSLAPDTFVSRDYEIILLQFQVFCQQI